MLCGKHREVGRARAKGHSRGACSTHKDEWGVRRKNTVTDQVSIHSVSSQS